MTMTLKVIANPWSAIDEKARPCGAVLRVDDNHVHQGKYIGAKMVAEELAPRKTRRIGRSVEILQDARHDRTFQFSSSPVEVTVHKGRPTGYYLDRIRDGSLIPADAECAAACGVKYRAPAELIAESKTKRRTEWDAQHGLGSFDAMDTSVSEQPSRPARPQVSVEPTEPFKASVSPKRTAPQSTKE